MKKGIFICVLLVASFALMGQGSPWYDFEAVPVCWDSAGTQVQLYSVKLYRVGKKDAQQVILTDRDKNQIIPTIGTLVNGHCSPYNPPVLTDYDSSIRSFPKNTVVFSYSPFDPLDEFREVLVYNYTSAVIQINFNVLGVPGIKQQLVAPFSSIELPQPKNLVWNQVKFVNLSISPDPNANNAGSLVDNPMIIINVKDY